MKASPADQVRLLDLQAVDTRLAQLDHREKGLPERARLASLVQLRDESAGAWARLRGELEDAEREVGRIESDVEVVSKRIVRDRERLNATSSPKDAAGLESELVSLQRRRGDLEDMELTVLERVEGLTVQAAAAEQKVSGFDTERTALELSFEAARAEIGAERDRILGDREAIVRALPTDLVELYERQRARYGIGAARLLRRVSGGSGVTLTESDLAEIRAAAPDDVVVDPDSGCILIRDQESGL